MLSVRAPIVRLAFLSSRFQTKFRSLPKRQQVRPSSTDVETQRQSMPSTGSPPHDNSPGSSTHKQCNIEEHLSIEAKSRTLSTLSKFIFGFSGIPDMVSLHGGLPPPSIFPFKSLKMELKDGQVLDIPAGNKVSPHLTVAHLRGWKHSNLPA